MLVCSKDPRRGGQGDDDDKDKMQHMGTDRGMGGDRTHDTDENGNTDLQGSLN